MLFKLENIPKNTNSTIEDKPLVKHIVFQRVLATLFDFFLFVVFSSLLAWLFGTKVIDTEDHSQAYRMNDECKFLVVIVLFLYFPVCHFFFSATLGKLLLGLKIESRINQKNKMIQFLLYFVRNLIAIIENGTLFLPIILLVIFNKRLSDLFTKTTVILSDVKIVRVK